MIRIAAVTSWYMLLASGPLLVYAEEPEYLDCTQAPNGTHTFDCSQTGCCQNPNLTCFLKDGLWGECLETCVKGRHDNDPEELRTAWSCSPLATNDGIIGHVVAAGPLLVDAEETEYQDCTQASNAAHTFDCSKTGCCQNPNLTCFLKDGLWGECSETCVKGRHDDDPEEFRTAWSCSPLATKDGIIGHVVVKEFGQCGGMLSGQKFKKYEGPTECQAGCECVRENDWISICQPLLGYVDGEGHADTCIHPTWTNGTWNDTKIDGNSLSDAADPKVQYLVEHGADVEARDSSGWTVLMKAAKNGHLATTKYLVENGASTNSKNADGITPLMPAVETNHLPTIQYLVEQGSDVDAMSRFGYSSLMLASMRGHLDTAKYLVANGANVEAQNPRGQSALQLAAQYGHPSIAKFLEGVQAAPPHMLEQLAKHEEKKSIKESTQSMLASGKFWVMVACSVCFVALALVLSLPSAGYGPLRAPQGVSPPSRGSLRLAIQANYSAVVQLAAKEYRAVEVFSNSIALMHCMVVLYPPLWLIVLAVLYVLPGVLTMGASAINKPALLLASTWQSSLAPNSWSGKSCVKCSFGAIRLGLLICMCNYMQNHPAWYTNPAGFSALKIMRNNPSENVCFRVPRSSTSSRSQPPWNVSSGDCSVDQAGCLLSPGFPNHYERNTECHVKLQSSAHFEFQVQEFMTEIVNDELTINGKSFSGSEGPYGIIPSGDIQWKADGSTEDRGWKLCPGKDFCVRVVPVGDLWGQGETTGQAIVITYMVASAVLVVLWLVLRALGLEGTSDKEQMFNLALKIMDVLAQHPSPHLAADEIAKIEGPSGREVAPIKGIELVPPGGVRFMLMSVLFDIVLHLNTGIWLLLDEHYFFAGIILATVMALCVTEVWNGNIARLPHETEESLRTGVLTEGFSKIVDRERSFLAFIALFVTAYALPFAATNPYQTFTGMLSLLTATWGVSAYVYEHIDLAFEDEELEALNKELGPPLCPG